MQEMDEALQDGIDVHLTNQQLNNLFNKADTDHDGHLNLDEFKKLISMLDISGDGTVSDVELMKLVN